MKSLRTVLPVVLLALGGAACSSPEQEPVEPEETRAFEVPAGVTLTEPGTTLEVGESATVVLDLGDGAASAVTVEVTDVDKGRMKDFEFFSLDARTRSSTPFYVEVAVTNEGPAGLGGVTIPLVARSDADVAQSAAELVGTFDPCPTPTVPKSFLTGAQAEICLVYLLPDGESLETFDLVTDPDAEPVRWTP